MPNIFVQIANRARKFFTCCQKNSSTSNTDNCIVDKTEKAGIIEYLPAEIQLDILKYLSPDELIKIKQTNRHFYDFINEYEGVLACKKYSLLCLFSTTIFCGPEGCGSLDVNNLKQDIEAIDLPLNNHLKKKWQSALDNEISVFILRYPLRMVRAYKNDFKPMLVFIEKGLQAKNFSLKLPLFPQNIEELKIVRYWLMNIFSCDFDDIDFQLYILNPEIIKLLFNNEEITKLKFNCRDATFTFRDHDISIWKFTFDHLVISEGLVIKNATDKYCNILFELLSNVDDGIPAVIFENNSDEQLLLYNSLLNLIETSTNLSKMVDKLRFDSHIFCWPISKLTVKGVEMNESNNTKKCYKITNINNSKMMFKIFWNFEKEGSDLIKSIEIVRIR